jgi:8-amino-7-oxononanoate synthase
MDPTLNAALSTALDTLDAQHRRRRLRSLRWQDGALREMSCERTLIDCSSNDYLGLSQHPLVRERAADWALRHGAGAPASRLVTGTRDITTAVEEKLAAFKGCEAALVFPAGFQTNATVIPALAALSPDTLIFSDALNHASLIHGCRLAKAQTHRYRHNDLNHLDDLLRDAHKHSGRRLIITESVFSMDGDRAPLTELRALAERYGAALYVDEAHATGVLGPQGRGLCAAPELTGGVDVVMGTLGKGMGAFGAYIAGSRLLIDYLTNTCAGFIYTTALPPAVLGAVDAALDLIPTMDAARAQLAAHSERLRSALHRQGLETLHSSTQIIPAVIGTEADALTRSQTLLAHGILAVAIRPPTVPVGTSRLRFSLHAGLSDDDVATVIKALACPST